MLVPVKGRYIDRTLVTCLDASVNYAQAHAQMPASPSLRACPCAYPQQAGGKKHAGWQPMEGGGRQVAF